MVGVAVLALEYSGVSNDDSQVDVIIFIIGLKIRRSGLCQNNICLMTLSCVILTRY